MKTNYLPLTVLLLYILELSCGYIVDKTEYHIEKINHGTEEEIKITDRNGKLVATIGLYLEDEYQNILPEDSYVCLIARLDMRSDISVCYDRVPLQPGLKGIESKTEKCGDRPLFRLAERDCAFIEDTENGTDREKRETHRKCTYYPYPVTVCVEEESYCKIKGWFFHAWKCKSWGTRCKRYEITYRMTNNCPTL
ncbi:uncharacterized protein LOC123553517 [Mercenaria mercenaria]|uniref:uncharacterized protein LOC123553517 n=1 Tax=Mercenaria mercenaria TaxID=6596 RepID=UPI001E1D7830|nr:uncharacterized protein LOC123553517 [Mercenaria mercenaria]